MIWGPHQEKLKQKNLLIEYRTESIMRMNEIKDNCEMKWFVDDIDIVNGTKTFDNKFKGWGLMRLIYNGWNGKILDSVRGSIIDITALSFVDTTKTEEQKKLIAMPLIKSIQDKLK